MKVHHLQSTVLTICCALCFVYYLTICCALCFVYYLTICCALCFVYYLLCIIFYTLSFVHYLLCTIFCALYNIHHLLCTVPVQERLHVALYQCSHVFTSKIQAYFHEHNTIISGPRDT
jgi:hypothetical protein